MRSRWFAVVLSVVACTACVAPTRACLWDRDTLAAEARGIPGVVDIIVGRFDRWPDEVYATRLERVTKELGADPTRLDLYDDAGVACDRLGRHGDAIEWMTRKRAVLDAAEGDQSEHEYRYLANLGTFYAHHWLATGASRSDLTDLESARDLIAAAIELNPEAHFGREKYQLAAIKWIIDAPDPRETGDQWGIVAPGSPSVTLTSKPIRIHGVDGEVDPADAIEGLSGLIVLGNAWESLDVYAALARSLEAHGDSSLAYLARLRCEELLENDKQTLNPNARFSETPGVPLEYVGEPSTYKPQTEAYYWRARAAVERRNESRKNYVLAQISAGRHPDTHADFMAGFKEPRAPSIPNGLLGLDSMQQMYMWGIIYLIVIPVTAIIALWFGIRFLIHRRRAAGLAA